MEPNQRPLLLPLLNEPPPPARPPRRGDWLLIAALGTVIGIWCLAFSVMASLQPGP